MKKVKNVILFGASSGGIHALREVVLGLSKDLPAAVFAVLHLSPRSNAEVIVQLLQKQTSLKCMVPENDEHITNGYFYLVPADHHMMIKHDKIILNQGVRENSYRPSVDVLFRSAAVSYGSRAIGVILTGLLDDGTSGMSAIQRCGGITIVQDPSEAEYPDMPKSVLNAINVDYRLSISEISGVLNKISNGPVRKKIHIPKELKVEAEITEKRISSIGMLKKMADPSDFACPECGGGLWAVRNDHVKRYRCHTGHNYTEQMLYELQGQNIEESIWVSIRMMEERRNLLKLMDTHSKKSGEFNRAQVNQERIVEMGRHIDRLKFVLAKLTEDLPEKTSKKTRNTNKKSSNK